MDIELPGLLMNRFNHVGMAVPDVRDVVVAVEIGDTVHGRKPDTGRGLYRQG